MKWMPNAIGPSSRLSFRWGSMPSRLSPGPLRRRGDRRLQDAPDQRGARRDHRRVIVGVAPAGFEPAISALKGPRPRPLDDGAVSSPNRLGAKPTSYPNLLT